MPLPRGDRDCSRSLLSTPAVAALKLGWPVGRLRYYEARYRDELGCLRLPNGEPLFTDRQLQVLANIDVWLQKDKTPDALVRERLRALSNWLTEDLPLAPAPTTSPAPTESITPGPPEEPPARVELTLLNQQLQDLVERVGGLEETLSALLAYLQAMPAPAAPATAPPEPATVTQAVPPPQAAKTPRDPEPQNSAAPVIKHSRVAPGSVHAWKPRDLESELEVGSRLDPDMDKTAIPPATSPPAADCIPWISPE